MNNVMLQVLNSTPINRTARIVTSQRFVAQVDSDIGRDELLEALRRLERKQRLMKHVLRIKNGSQQRNLVYNFNKGLKSYHGFSRRFLAEYKEIGESIQAVIQRIAVLKKESAPSPEVVAVRKKLGAVENKWREEHPGAIWDGRQLIAPNGAVFSRSAVACNLEVA